MEAVKQPKEAAVTSKQKSTFFMPNLQKKLSVGSANDSYEAEADQVADKVMKMPDSSPQVAHTGALLQRKCAACQEEEKKLQMKPLSESITPLIQRSSESSGESHAPDHIESRINASKGSGSLMENGTKNFMEQRFGADFSNVRIHTGSEAVQMSRDLNAQAFAVGNNIYFNEGKYNPGTSSGQHLLTHELTHTIQQGGGVATKRIQRLPFSHGDPIHDPLLDQFSNDTGLPRDSVSQHDPLYAQWLNSQSISPGNITGGVTGLRMNVTSTYSSCGACRDGLEAIQVFWGTRRTDGVQVGTHQTVFPPLAATYDSFVDGGINSPGGATYSGNHPYYIGLPALPSSYGYNPSMGSAGSASGCTVNPEDAPSAARLHDEAYFETAFVCLNYLGTNHDKLLESFKWGFANRGTTFKSSPTNAAGGGIVTASSPSTEFLNTLAADYPGYP
ncbi:eCIS core domain-containing protein [Chryseobacterium tongliaoense]|uniref:eCIS core domain-containing protein n=1 Tax=Chryseobacterium tongliaoense TaxID=3240933 RepID=UPI003514EA95